MIMRWGASPKNGKNYRAQVFVDGIEVSRVVFADEEAGAVYVLKEIYGPPVKNDIGTPVFDTAGNVCLDSETGDFAMQRITGCVEIRLP